MWHNMTQHMWGNGSLSMSFYMGIYWIIALLAFGAVVWVLMRSGQSDALQRGDNRALKVLEERYARGEIGKEEFLEKRGDLER